MTPAHAVETIDVRANGLRFAVDTCGGGDRLALCLHGFPEAAISWRYQLPLLAALGYRAWAPDLRGYGRSARPLGIDAYRPDRLVADVAALVDASGAASVTLIGHDWGAALAWLFATDRIRPLDRLVIMNVPHPALFVRALRTPQQALRSWYIAFFQIPRLPEALLGANGAAPIARAVRATAAHPENFTADVIGVYRRNALEPGALTAMINWYRAIARAQGAVTRRTYPPIDVPTLLIWGDADIALRKETTFGTGAYVRDLTVRYLPGISHWVQQDAPQTVNAMLAAFLTGAHIPEASESGEIS